MTIIRNVRFFNAITYSLSGSTTVDVLDKLQDLLPSLPDSVSRIIVHCGTNDNIRRHSDLTKADFNNLFNFLKRSGKFVFISGPIPTLDRDYGHFSRILSLHTWLLSSCRAHNVGFIDNFNLFWARNSLFKSDGLHPSFTGSKLLAAKIQNSVQTQD